MFHPVLPPQLPPSLESLKPVDHLASTTVVKVKTDRRKLIIVDKNQNSKYQFNTRLVNEDVVTNNQLFSEQSAVLAETSIPDRKSVV